MVDLIQKYRYSNDLEQRRTQRYQLQLPLQIVQLGDQTVEPHGENARYQFGRSLFLSPTDVEVGGRIEYLITLSGSNPPVRIRCLGKCCGVCRRKRRTLLIRSRGHMERYQFVRPENWNPSR